MDIFGAIGKLLGSVFSDKKKKPQQVVQQPQQVQQPGRPINNSGFINIPNGNRPQQQIARPTLAPSVNTAIINAPKPAAIQAPQTFNPSPIPQGNVPNGNNNPSQQNKTNIPNINDAGKFLLNGTAKGINTAIGGGALAGTEISGGLGKLFGTRAGNDQVLQQERNDINNRFLKPGAGLFGAGGNMSVTDFKTADPLTALRKGAGTGGQIASEVLPVGKGSNIASKAAPIAQKVASGLIQGGVSGGLGSLGSQTIEGQFNPQDTIKSTALGALIGGGIPASGAAIKGAATITKDATGAVQSRVKDITSQPGYDSQRGSIQLPGRSKETPIESTQKLSGFKTNTVPVSQNVSDPLKAIVRNAPRTTYDGVTNQGHLEQSLRNVNDQGVDGLVSDVTNRLNTRNGHIDSQTVADTLTAAQALDVKGDHASLDKAADLYDKLSSHLTASGQTVQAASLILRRSPEGLQLGAYRQLRKAGVDLTPEIRQRITSSLRQVKAAPEGSQARQDAVAGFVQDLGKQIPQSTVKNLTGVWKAGLLSGVKTQGGNFLSNATFNGVKKASDPLAAAIDQVLSIGTNKRTKSFTLKGIGSGTREGVSNAKYTLKTGIDRRNGANPNTGIADKYEQHSEINFQNPTVQKIIGTPANFIFRGMAAADQPFYYASLKNNLYDMAKADGINLGLKGNELSKHMENFVANPPAEAVQTATNAAEKAVLGNDTFASKAISSLKKGIDNSDFSNAGKIGANAVIDRIAPFTKVPSAFLSRVVDYTPVGVVKEIASQISHKKFDQRALSEALSEGITGSGIIYLGAELANNDMLSGNYPNDPKEQARWKAEGITPNSIKLGNTWYDLNYLGPLGLLFGAGKNITDASKTGDNQAVAAAAGVGKGLLNQSFLQGFTGFSNAIDDPGRYGQGLVNSQISSSVPALSNDIANATDAFQRQANNPLEAAAGRIPGLRQNLKPKIDAFGNDLKQPSGAINAAINPLKPSDAKTTPLLSELDRLGNAGQSTFPTTDKTIKVGAETVKLTPDQQRDYNKKTGQKTQEIWGSITKDSGYEALGDDQKKKWLDNAMSDINTVAKKQYLEQIGRKDLADTIKLTSDQKAYADGNVDTNLWKPGSAKTNDNKASEKGARKSVTKSAGKKKVASSKKGKSGKKVAKFKIPKSSFNRVASTSAIRKLIQSSGNSIKEKK